MWSSVMKCDSRTAPFPDEQPSSDAGNICRPASDTPRSEAAERWLEENREALESYNDYVDRNGIPLTRYRQF